MMSDGESTVRGRELGDAVRVAMERTDLTGKRLSELLAWSESKISRIVTGHVVPSEMELAALLALCGVVGKQRDSLLDLRKDQALSNWSAEPSAVVKHQQSASKITEFHNSLVPPLLQAEGYSRSVACRMVNIADDDIDSWIATRQQARAVLDRLRPKPPICTFFIHQLALELPVGGPEVMSTQLHHILRIGARRNIAVRVIPTALGAYPSTCGPFCFMDFSAFPPVAYVEDEAEGHFLEGSVKIATYQRLIAALSVTSLSPAESMTVMREKATAYSGIFDLGQE